MLICWLATGAIALTNTVESGVTNSAASEAAAVAAVNKNAREWKSVSGATIVAEYEGTDRGQVKLKVLDGSVVAIPLSRLSAPDQAWVNAKGAKEEEPTTAKKRPSKILLPIFTSGEWENYHAVYISKNFDALMDTTGVVYVYPKVNGKRIGSPIRCSMNCYYADTTTNVHVTRGRPIERLAYEPKPSKQPQQITLCGTLTDSVPFNLTVAFSDKGIKAWGYCDDPSDLRDRTLFRIGAHIPASHHFTDATPLDERKRILDGWQVKFEPISGKKWSYDYNDSLQSMGGYAETVRISAPVYGKRGIWFAAGDEEFAPLVPRIYPGFCPWQGYSVYLQKRNPSDRSAKLYFNLVVQ